jgi:hypothetical protein
MQPAPPRPGRARSIACPNCGGTVVIRANGLSISAACASCGAIIDVASPDLALIGAAQARTRRPLIAIGARAELVGTLWEVVGFQTRSDVIEGWSWEEYLLFSPYQGFRFLVHDEENWTLYAMLPQDVPDPGAGAGDGRRYKLMSESRARTDYVLGEFYWRVKAGDEVAVAEYGASPHLLSCETSGDEVTWSRGLQLKAGQVAAAFGLEPEDVPPTVFDTALARREDSRAVMKFTGLALLLLVLLSAAPFGRSRNALLFSHGYVTSLADRGRPVATPDFTVPDAAGNVAIVMNARVTNAWMEFSLSLVNVATQAALNADVTVSEYEGVDEDGAWTEGGRTAEAVFAHVPGGVYRLLIDTDAQAFRTGASDPALRQVSFAVSVRRHVPSSGVFWLAFAVLLAYPLWRLTIGRLFAQAAEGTRA